MATTTNFGWETPDDTDLVKDGAAAIRTALGGVDTSFVDLKGGTTGQVLSKASNTDLDYTWVTTDDANAIQNAIVDAKGDLIAASAADTPARLAVGNNGETLVADSSTSTGLRYQGNFAAGKNKIINGDFGIWQRGTSTSTNGAFIADRFKIGFGGTGTTQTMSQQTFTAGTAPVAGYEGTFFARNVVVGGTGTSSLVVMQQPVEDVRTFAGQTVTLSFWAKAASGTPSIGLDLYQEFGSGGSGTVSNGGTKVAITTSWARYSATISLASVAGKTIGAGSLLGVRLWFSSGSDYNSLNGTLGLQSGTFDIWGVQLEAGSVVTAFQTATGTIQGELAACQRYFIRIGGNKIYEVMGLGYTDSTTETYASRTLPVTMRTTPSTTFAAANLFRTNQGGGTVATGTGIGQDGNASSPNLVNFYLQYSAAGAASRGAAIQANNSTSATMDISAEL